MGLDGILFYCLRAVRFALTVGAVYAALRILAVCRGRAKPQPERFALQLTAVCYLAALTEIVALRGLTVTGRSVQWLPLGTIGPLAAGTVVSFALELTQFVLATGASDLDDILLNALGALLGWGVWRLGHALRQKGR